MSLKEKVLQKVSELSDNNLHIILALAEEMLRQENVTQVSSLRPVDKKIILQEMLEMRESSRYPDDFDYEKELEEANYGISRS